MAYPVWHHYVTLISFFAAVIGLFILHNDRSVHEDFDDTNWMLLAMSYAYWIVHCCTDALQTVVPLDWPTAIYSLKLTALFSLLLTFSCAFSLPLNRIALKNQQTE
jgi:hypothetical protein